MLHIVRKAQAVTVGDSEDSPVPDQDAEPGADDAPVVAPAREHKPRLSFWQELPILVAIAVGLAVLIKSFLFQAFIHPVRLDGADAARLSGLPG